MSGSKLNIFCVSTAAYQQLGGRAEREAMADNFPTPQHTNIPSLQEYAQECTFRDRERIADKILTDLKLLNFSIRQWAEEKEIQQLSQSQVEKLNAELEQHYQEWELVCSIFIIALSEQNH